MKSQLKRFTAVLEKGDPSLGWTVVRVPFAPAEVWTKRVRQRVRGTINGVIFRSSLLPDAHLGTLVVLVNRSMQASSGAVLGSWAEFELEPDLEARPAHLPEELAGLFAGEAEVESFYESLSESTRRELGKWIAGVKSPTSRTKRAEQTMERLLRVMEAEVELPPALSRAFHGRPRAKEGWLRLTQTHVATNSSASSTTDLRRLARNAFNVFAM